MKRPEKNLQATRRLLGCGLIVACFTCLQPALAQVGVGPIDNTLDRTLPGRGSVLDDPLQRRLEERRQLKRQQVEETVEPAVRTIEPVVDTAGSSLEPISGTTTELIDGLPSTLSTPLSASFPAPLVRSFYADVDPLGQPIEKHVLVILAAESDLAGLLAFGMNVVEQRPLSGLGLVLLTLQSDGRQPLAELAETLRQAFPDSSVDYNHLYQSSTDESGFQASSSETDLAADKAGIPAMEEVEKGAATGDGEDYRQATTPADSQQALFARPLRIGMIDSALQRDHPALLQQNLTERDFVHFEGERPRDHGTAVASLLLDAGRDASLQLLAASVFFSAPDQARGASTESLIEAIGWLASEDVDVINISLAGPANSLLERIMLQLAQSGPSVVAAVGNHGPAAPPAYPAAYSGVTGVTAVDRHQKIFPFANQGRHVDFAAYGVGVRVADDQGGWRTDSGTSMAAPLVTIAVARALQQWPDSSAAALQILVAEARDLGAAGYDTVFGHGLVLPDSILRTMSQN